MFERKIGFSEKDVEDLVKMARVMRKEILEMTTFAKSGHPTTALSCIDLMTAIYFHEMNHDPKNPEWPNRDRFVLSKGHGAPALYACLANAGYFSKEEYKSLRRINGLLQGHPDIKIPGVEIASGSLGMGLSVGNGMALAGKIDGLDFHVYVLLGDGELQEGQCWEAIMTTPFFGLNNVTVIVDRNNLQNDGWVDETKNIEPLRKKFEAFGWRVFEINGHDMKEILRALSEARDSSEPCCVIAKTIKGKGVKFIENDPNMHGKPLSEDDLKRALEVLE